MSKQVRKLLLRCPSNREKKVKYKIIIHNDPIKKYSKYFIRNMSALYLCYINFHSVYHI